MLTYVSVWYFLLSFHMFISVCFFPYTFATKAGEKTCFTYFKSKKPVYKRESEREERIPLIQIQKKCINNLACLCMRQCLLVFFIFCLFCCVLFYVCTRMYFAGGAEKKREYECICIYYALKYARLLFLLLFFLFFFFIFCLSISIAHVFNSFFNVTLLYYI